MIKCRNQIEKITLSAILTAFSALFFLIGRTGFIDSPFYLIVFLALSILFYNKTSLPNLYLLYIPISIISAFFIPIYNVPIVIVSLALSYLSMFFYSKRGSDLIFFLCILFSALIIEIADISIKSLLLGVDTIEIYITSLESILNTIVKNTDSLLYSFLQDIIILLVIIIIFLYDFIVALICFILVKNYEISFKLNKHHKKKTINITIVYFFHVILFIFLFTTVFFYFKLPYFMKIIFQIMLGIYILCSILFSLIYPSSYLIVNRKTDFKFFMIFVVSLITSFINSLLFPFWLKRIRRSLLH